MKKYAKEFFAVCVLVANISCFSEALGQASDEIWPEIDGIYRLNDKFRLMAMLSATRKQSENTDGSFALYFDYFIHPFFKKLHSHPDSTRGYYQWLRIGYTYGRSSSGQEDEFKENMINLESNTRFHLPVQFLVTVKNRFDTRVYNGDLKERYRPRLTLERDCKTQYLTFTPYFYGEYYFNFNGGSSNRYRLCLGTELWVTKIISFEVYYLKQLSAGSSSSTMNAAGIALKFNLERKYAQAQVDKPVEERIRAK